MGNVLAVRASQTRADVLAEAPHHKPLNPDGQMCHVGSTANDAECCYCWNQAGDFLALHLFWFVSTVPVAGFHIHSRYLVKH